MSEREQRLKDWTSYLWVLMTKIQNAEGESESDFGAMVRLAWKEGYRSLRDLREQEAILAVPPGEPQ